MRDEEADPGDDHHGRAGDEVPEHEAAVLALEVHGEAGGGEAGVEVLVGRRRLAHLGQHHVEGLQAGGALWRNYIEGDNRILTI